MRIGRLWLTLLLCASLVGCQEEESEERIPVYPVRGKVTFQGAPVAGADVSFFPSPSHGGPSSRGVTDAQGNFTLTTYVRDDGAPAGTYRVTIVRYAETEDIKAEDRDEAPNTLPTQFAAADSSPLTATIAVGENNLPAYDLQP